MWFYFSWVFVLFSGEQKFMELCCWWRIDVSLSRVEVFMMHDLWNNGVIGGRRVRGFTEVIITYAPFYIDEEHEMTGLFRSIRPKPMPKSPEKWPHRNREYPEPNSVLQNTANHYYKLSSNVMLYLLRPDTCSFWNSTCDRHLSASTLIKKTLTDDSSVPWWPSRSIQSS